MHCNPDLIRILSRGDLCANTNVKTEDVGRIRADSKWGLCLLPLENLWKNPKTWGWRKGVMVTKWRWWSDLRARLIGGTARESWCVSSTCCSGYICLHVWSRRSPALRSLCEQTDVMKLTLQRPSETSCISNFTMGEYLCKTLYLGTLGMLVNPPELTAS